MGQAQSSCHEEQRPQSSCDQDRSCQPHDEDQSRQSSCDQDRSCQPHDEDQSRQSSCDQDQSHSSCGGDGNHCGGGDLNGLHILSLI
jgi:hypothetical protein